MGITKQLAKLTMRTILTGVVLGLCAPAFAKTKPAVKKNEAVAVPALVNLVFAPESRVQLHGDSTLRKFSAASTAFELSGTARPQPGVFANLPWIPVEVEMVLEVSSLTSRETTLDEHMHKNLNAEKFPQIILKISDFKSGISRDGKNFPITAGGTLTVAGITNQIELLMNLTQEGENLRITGKKNLLMSDFGIEPPAMMLGTLKTRNEIEINFNVICTTESKQKGS